MHQAQWCMLSSAASCYGDSQKEVVNLSNLQWGNGIIPCKCKEYALSKLLNNVWKSLKQSEENDAQLRRQLISLNLYRQVDVYNCNASFPWLLAYRYWYPSSFTIDTKVFQLLLANMYIFLVTADQIWVTVDVIQLSCIWNTWFLKKNCWMWGATKQIVFRVSGSVFFDPASNFIHRASKQCQGLSVSLLCIFNWKRIVLANAREMIKDLS